jgi:hypothetical protein
MKRSRRMEEEKREEINETGSIELTHNNRKHNIKIFILGYLPEF